jgi:hypothetical protein
MKLLFVAFEFPPIGGGGVHRSIKFTKYLRDFGVDPVVLTTELESFRRVISNPVDETLLDELPDGLDVERVSCLPPDNFNKGKFSEWRRIFFSLVDGPQAKFWKPHLVQQLPRILAEYKPEAIFVTLPPFCMAPLWCEIAERVGLPIILDFRDGWSHWRVSPYGSWVHYRMTLQLERACLRRAARVICSSDQIRADLLSAHPSVPASKLVTITNGFDADIDEWHVQGRADGGDEFRIGYVGSFYYTPENRAAMMSPWWRKRPNRMLQYTPRKEDWLYRSPYFFFRALSRVLERRPELRRRLRLRFAGQKPNWIGRQLEEFGLTDLAEFHGYLDHGSVLKFQAECDALLVTSSKVIGGQDYSIAGKTFEYFSMRRPILGFVAEGAQKNILQRSGLALICDPDDSEGSARKLSDLIDGKVRFAPDDSFLHGLHRRNLTRQLADVIKASRAATSSGERGHECSDPSARISWSKVTNKPADG